MSNNLKFKIDYDNNVVKYCSIIQRFIKKKCLKKDEVNIDFAEKLGTEVIIGLIRGRLINTANHNNQKEKGNHAMCSCISYAEEREVTLFLEAINRYETNIINTAQEALDIINHFGSKYLKILLDTIHMNIEERSIEVSISKTGSHIGYILFSDSNRLAPGWDHIDFSEVLSALKHIEYAGFAKGNPLYKLFIKS